MSRPCGLASCVFRAVMIYKLLRSILDAPLQGVYKEVTMRKGKCRMVLTLTAVVATCIFAYIGWIRIVEQRDVAPLSSYAQTHWFNLGEPGYLRVIQPRGLSDK